MSAVRSPLHPPHVLIAAATLSALLAVPASAAAQKSEREILGWTSTGQEIVVRLTEQGERMVDGVSKNYYFQLTEIWSARDAALVQRYRHGEASGSPPAEFESAKSAELGGKYLATAGLSEATLDYQSPDDAHRLETFSSERTDSPEDGRYLCSRRYRLVLLSQKTSNVYTLVDDRAKGEVVRRPDEAMCPPHSVEPAWSPNGRRWAAFLTVGSDSKLFTGGVDALEPFAHADFISRSPFAAKFAGEKEAAAWMAISDGDWDGAKTAFGEQAIATALVDALRGEGRSAIKAADKAYRDSAKSPRDEILRAATYIAANETKKAAKWVDTALEKAAGYNEMIQFAAIFELVDLKLASQIAVRALSHPSAEGQDTQLGWVLLARLLLGTGDYSKAEEALSRIEKPGTDALLETASLHLDRNETRRASQIVDDLLFSNPGRCEAYLLAGRTLSKSGRHTEASSMFSTAAFCDPTLDEALFYAADFARLAGDLDRAKKMFDRYVTIAPPRRFDTIREARRAVAKRWAERLGHQGAVITDGACRRVAADYVCSGTIHNTSTDPLDKIAVEVRRKGKKLGEATTQTIEPGASQPFGVRFEAKSLADVEFTAGRNKSEKLLNTTPAR